MPDSKIVRVETRQGKEFGPEFFNHEATGWDATDWWVHIHGEQGNVATYATRYVQSVQFVDSAARP